MMQNFGRLPTGFFCFFTDLYATIKQPKSRNGVVLFHVKDAGRGAGRSLVYYISRHVFARLARVAAPAELADKAK